MPPVSLPIACEVEFRAGEEFRLPEELTKRLRTGRWLITVQPADAPPRIRDHSAFLNGYSPEDEGLYDDAPTR